MEVKKMNTQEAIEFINMVVDGIEKIAFCPTTKIMEPIKKDAKKVVSLLQQGEKYRQIVEELSRILPKPRYIYKNCNGKAFEYYCNANAIEVLNSVKQKYFPKEAKSDGS